MEMQNQVILGLGSNQGNRLATIQLAIESIHNEVGTVVNVSKLYETPAWGFESTSFYNCVLLINTSLCASVILDKVLNLEKKLGRVRSNSNGYQSRIIDIDVIAFNEDVLITKDLKVPHPLMQDRLFVLLPMQDLGLKWNHPILQKQIPELIKESKDKSICKVIQELQFPLQKIHLQKFNYIAIEGNIGAGKTSLVNKIAQDFNAKTILERYADNPFLPKFYEDQNRYAFSLEMSFLADRFQQISDDLSQLDLFKDFVLADYHVFKSLIFAKVTLSEEEYRLYKKLFDIIYKEMPKPDLYVYLYQNTDRLLQNIRQRGRYYEQEIPAAYLEKINSGYLEYIKSQKGLNVVIIDISDKDFVSNHLDYISVLNEISDKII